MNKNGGLLAMEVLMWMKGEVDEAKATLEIDG